jgi:thioredoxin
MSFMLRRTFLCLTAAAAIIAASAGCSKPKERETATEQLPVITSPSALDSALARAGDRTVVLDFYADWCRPCRLLAPLVYELAREHRGKTDFYRVNIDRSTELSNAFRVRGIPYLVFMKGGKPVYALPGMYPKEEYEKTLAVCESSADAEDCAGKFREQE